MKKYLPNEIESKWQEKWKEERVFATDLSKPNKFYVLAEFAYPSGDLHMGHWFTFAGADVYARLKRMQGYNVFFPNGFDAFGLPAENAAIKRSVHPQDWTLSNIARMKDQYSSMGATFTFDHEVITCLPEYYKWNQWVFLRMLEKGIAYRGKYLSNWCNVCQTVLANEAVEAGTCWRCHTEVEQKEVEQWFYKITDYAERLLWSEEPSVNWPKSLRDAQNSWIGKSEGAVIKFEIRNSKFEIKDLEVFTTRPDTIFGATFLVLAPEHPVLTSLANSKFKVQSSKLEEIKLYTEKSKKKSELERKENKEKSGVFTGILVKNPLTGEDIPVWVADYVLSGYGTGAIMAVPAHDERDFEFAKKFNLPIKYVVGAIHESPEERAHYPKGTCHFVVARDAPLQGDGILINSGEFNDLTTEEAKQKITNYIVEHQLGEKMTYYHLHDWSISRQRYWGTPVPIIHCPSCGIVPVPEKDLPVELPYEVDYTPKGKPPLASNEEWMKVKCPKCNEDASRDPETMDTFIDSSWYFFRFLDPKYDKAPFEKELAKKIMPVDIYFGGAEHNLGHTLYSRFFTKIFHDLGLTDLEEYAARRINHGVILGPDGNRMSKSRGNVVNPDEEVKKYGADTIRVYLAFFMPYEATGPWVPERIWGAYRFLERIWGLYDKVALDVTKGLGLELRVERLDPGSIQMDSGSEAGMTAKDLAAMHKTIKKVTDDIEAIKYNTAVAALMEWLNYLSKKGKVSREEYQTLLLLLAPFAPHITEELWQITQLSVLGYQLSDNGQSVISRSVKTDKLKTENWSIHTQSWPKYDEKYLEDEEITIAVSVNGKVRDQIVIHKDIVNNKSDIEKRVMESSKVQKFIDKKEIKTIIYVPGKIINIVTN